MRIAFDSRVFENSSSGVKDVAAGLLRGLSDLEEDGLAEVVLVGTRSLKDLDVRVVPARGFMQFGLSQAAVESRCDVILVPRQTRPIMSRVPVVPVFHDIGFIVRRDLYPSNLKVEMMTRLAARSKHAVAVSEFTSSELREHGLRRETSALEIGAFHSVGWDPDTDAPYALYVAAHQPHKNLIRAIEAWDAADTADYTLVICGRGGNAEHAVREAHSHARKRDAIRLVSGLSDVDYARLLRRAHLYFQPSLYEGLGIPALDAAAAGQPLIAANVANLSRAFAGAPDGQLFDGSSVESIASAIETGLHDDGFRRASSTFNASRITLTDWRAVGTRLLDVIA